VSCSAHSNVPDDTPKESTSSKLISRAINYGTKKEQRVVILSFQETYEIIRKTIPRDTLIDSLEVAEQVEEYRQFWKPRIEGLAGKE